LNNGIFLNPSKNFIFWKVPC